MNMSQTVGKGVDFVQQRGQSVDRGTEEGKNESFTHGDILFELVICWEGVRVIDS